MNPFSIVALCILFVLYAWTVYNIPILAVGVMNLRGSGRAEKRTSPSRERELPTVSIIVPVRDEERVVGRLIDALLQLNYPPEKWEAIIAEDGSTDKTVEICEEYAMRCPGQIRLVRRSMSDGKPSALNYALRYASGEIVGTFDADSVPESDALMKAVSYFEDPSVVAVQGKTCSINADENMLTKFLSYEEQVQFEAYYRGKDVLGLFVPLNGSCQLIRREILEGVGGWNEDSLSEDMEMAVRLTEKGYKIKYAHDVRSWQESPANLTQLFRQRERWFRGAIEVGLKYGRLVKRRNRRCIDAEIMLAGPLVFIPCLLGYSITAYSLLFHPEFDAASTILANVTSLFTVFLLSITGIALIYATKQRKMSNVLWLPFIYAYWILQNFVASYALIQIVLRRPRRWAKTAKTGATTNPPLGFDDA